VTDLPFKFDEIGNWSEVKLEIVEKYGAAYTTAFKNTRLKKYYIDGFCEVAPVVWTVWRPC
jgi:hypothetical protein